MMKIVSNTKTYESLSEYKADWWKRFAEAGHKPKLDEEAREHEWFQYKGLTCCKMCGIVKRRDGKNKPCRGVVRVELRKVQS